MSPPAERLRARNLRTAVILAGIALIFFAGIIASRWLGGYDVGLSVVGGAVFLYLLLAIGRNLRGQSDAGPRQGGRSPETRRHGAPVQRDRASDDLRVRNRSVVRRLLLVVGLMFGFGFALVPLYEKFCEVTGIRNVMTADAPVNTQVDATRVLRVELDASARNLPFRIKAAEPVVSVHPGEVRQVVYEVVNHSSRPVVGQAIPSYAPREAAAYFRKLDCFCFTQQALAPGERRLMPVVFVIDPRLPGDLATITLSYTFFEVERGGS